jgi:hypothetical protein
MNQESLDLSGHKYEELLVEVPDFQTDDMYEIEMCKVCGLEKYQHETKAERFAPLNTILLNIRKAGERMEADFKQYPSMK